MISAGQQIYSWTVIAVNGRAAVVRCRCKEIRTVTVDLLIEGHCTSCGCSTPTPQKMKALREDYEDQKRRKNFSWRIESRGR